MEQPETIACDEDRQANSIRWMLGQFYRRQMLPLVALVWVIGLIAVAVMIFSAVRFFDGQLPVRGQIFYAVIFLTALQVLGMMKIIAWQLIHRNCLLARIGRLERRIEELRQLH